MKRKSNPCCFAVPRCLFIRAAMGYCLGMWKTLVVVLTLWLVVSPPAMARKPTAKDVATAKAHFKQGRAYYEAGAYGDAVKEYEKAYALTAMPDLLYNIGQAERLKGDKPKAIAAYQKYLAAVAEGTLAEEARSHVAALRLKIQVEEADAAKRKAQEELEASRRRTAELEEARRRAETDTEARIKRQLMEQERLRRNAAKRARLKKESDEREHARRVSKAKKRGYPLRASGTAVMVLGCVFLAGAVLNGSLMGVAIEKDFEKLQRTWLIGNAITGGMLLVGGIVLYRMGVTQRKVAVAATERSVTVMPVLGPGTAGVMLSGRF